MPLPTIKNLRAWFADLPLNRESVYVTGVCPGGCTVYVPLKPGPREYELSRKRELQELLDQLPPPPRPGPRPGRRRRVA